MSKKITDLTAITSAVTTDVMEITSDPGGTPLSKKITVANLMKSAQVIGDGTAGRILKSMKLEISDGTNANTVKVTPTPSLGVFNSDDPGTTDNVAKNATTGNYTLASDGASLIITQAGLSGPCIGILSCQTVYNTTALTFLINPIISSGGIYLPFMNADTAVDITGLAPGKKFTLLIAYLTSA